MRLGGAAVRPGGGVCGGVGRALAGPGDGDILAKGAEQLAALEIGGELEGKIDGLGHADLLELQIRFVEGGHEAEKNADAFGEMCFHF